MKDFEVEVVEQLVRSEVESRVEGKLRPISTLSERNHNRQAYLLLPSSQNVKGLVSRFL
jgi:hypothetical protein